MVALFSRILDVLLITLRPPAQASPAEIRRAGGRTVVLGAACLVVTAVVLALLPFRDRTLLIAVKLAAPLWVAGFGGVVIGSFRLVFAREPETMSSGSRMGLGVLFGCGALVLLMVLGLLLVFGVAWAVDP